MKKGKQIGVAGGGCGVDKQVKRRGACTHYIVIAVRLPPLSSSFIMLLLELLGYDAVLAGLTR